MLRGFSAFSELTEEEFKEDLSEQDMALIQASIDNEHWNTTIQSIVDYTKASMNSAITNLAVRKFIEAGVPGVRTGVMASRAAIIQLMNDYPCLRHEDPQIALVKVLYMQWYKRQKQESRASSRASNRPTSRPSSRASNRSNVSVSKDNALKSEFAAFKKWHAVQALRSQPLRVDTGTSTTEEEEQVEELSEGHEEEEEEDGVLTERNIHSWGAQEEEEPPKKPPRKSEQKKALKRK